MTLSLYLSFLLTCLIIEATPGPNMAWLAVTAAAHGRRAGFAATGGIALGLLTIGTAAACGVATLIAGSPFAWETLRWGGVAFMLWLAWDGWREEKPDDTATHNYTQAVKFFRRGLVINLLNPKAAVFYIAILPGFISPTAAPMPQALLLTVGYVAMATAMHALIVALAAKAQIFLENPRRRQITRRALSALLAAVALWFAWTTGGPR
jgi:threonine/homoserine/homoserine lactone efflux protein